MIKRIVIDIVHGIKMLIKIYSDLIPILSIFFSVIYVAYMEGTEVFLNKNRYSFHNSK